MRSGKLRQRVTIQNVTEGRTSTGAISETWGTFAIRRASVEPLSGREYFDAKRDSADISVRIRLRYDSKSGTITPKMRALYGSRVFDIESVINISERNREIVLMCREQV